jgi:hypothetical protein
MTDSFAEDVRDVVVRLFDDMTKIHNLLMPLALFWEYFWTRRGTVLQAGIPGKKFGQLGEQLRPSGYETTSPTTAYPFLGTAMAEIPARLFRIFFISVP